MSEDKTYNGWTNYETWNVSLWIDNDQYSQELIADEARTAKDVYSLEQFIKDFVEEQNPLADTATMFTDLMNAALSEVNWREIAENFWEEYHEEEEPDEIPIMWSMIDPTVHLYLSDFDYWWREDHNVYSNL